MADLLADLYPQGLPPKVPVGGGHGGISPAARQGTFECVSAATLPGMGSSAKVQAALGMEDNDFLKWVRAADDEDLEAVVLEIFNEGNGKRIVAQAELARRGRKQQASTRSIALWTLIVAGVGVAVTVAGIVLARVGQGRKPRVSGVSSLFPPQRSSGWSFGSVVIRVKP